MSGQIYTAVFEDVAVTAIQDFFELLAPTDMCVKLRRIRIGQESDAADAEAEMLAYKIVRGEGTVTSGSGGGTNPTSTPIHKGQVAASTVVEINNTTIMAVGTGALKVLETGAFHVAEGLNWEPVDDAERYVISPGDRLTVELEKAPGDELTMSGTIWFEEIGG
jgi:hypothetical protein